MPDQVPNMAPCLSQFFSTVAQKKLPPEFAKGFGLKLRGTVAAGFSPGGFAFPSGGAESFGVVKSDATWGEGAVIRVAFLDGTPTRKEQVEEFANLWKTLSGAHLEFKVVGKRDPSDIRVTFQ